MINEVYPNIYLNKIPQLTINPKSFTNSYIILSKPRNIVIDTGYNQKESREAIMFQLA